MVLIGRRRIGIMMDFASASKEDTRRKETKTTGASSISLGRHAQRVTQSTLASSPTAEPMDTNALKSSASLPTRFPTPSPKELRRL